MSLLYNRHNLYSLCENHKRPNFDFSSQLNLLLINTNGKFLTPRATTSMDMARNVMVKSPLDHTLSFFLMDEDSALITQFLLLRDMLRL